MAYPNGRGYYQRGPSPWVPATILGVILLITTTPFRMRPETSAFAYGQPMFQPTGLPPALIWIPIIFFLVIQFFGGGNHVPNRNMNERFPFNRPLMRSWSFGRGGGAARGYGDGTVYPGVADYYDRGYNNDPYNRGLMSSFMDYGGHWMLILLGIWLFTLIGPVNGMSSRRMGFPWSLFVPQPQVVLPMM